MDWLQRIHGIRVELSISIAILSHGMRIVIPLHKIPKLSKS